MNTEAELREKLIDALEDIAAGQGMYIKEGDKAGWYDTMALSHVRDAGDELVEMGLWERHPDGYGRRWFYRPKEAGR